MKTIYRIAVIFALCTMAGATLYVGVQLRRLNNNIEDIRSQIPMSLLGN